MIIFLAVPIWDLAHFPILRAQYLRLHFEPPPLDGRHLLEKGIVEECNMGRAGSGAPVDLTNDVHCELSTLFK